MLTELWDSELGREKMWQRIHLIPLLQAEEDRDQVRRHWADKAREKELMGAETKVYHSDRCDFHFTWVSLLHGVVLGHPRTETDHGGPISIIRESC